ncbi:MAG: pre-peptidase C-terminal domain-containing protein, partial [Proteobacteria bacterium]|nr:pre-peptidase C-terminal domain-containing protein [Pseudomonadota bacterium]
TTNYPGLHPIIKNYACPTSTCVPAENQAALYADRNYQPVCAIFEMGDYPNLDGFALEADSATSVRVGANAQISLYTAADFLGRTETFAGDDSNLSDNRIGAQTVSSLRVFTATVISTPTLTFPENGASFTDTQSVDLVGRDAGGGIEFQAQLQTPTETLTQAWQVDPVWAVGNLAAGAYSVTLRAGNAFTRSAWSQPITFTVEAGTPPAAAVTAPYSATMESDISGWTANGLWHLTETAAHSSSHSWWYSQPTSQNYNTGAPNFGDLTTPPITLPVAVEPYYLQFWQHYETEGQQSHWDQRRVQISVDGEAFTNTYQLYDDPMGSWLRVRVDLSDHYAAAVPHTLQVRFHFASLDGYANGFAGWYIDDVQVAAAPPPTCGDIHEPNETASQATNIAYGDTASAEICPGGDYDYYAFVGTEGDDIIADIDAQDFASPLDATLFLLDSDGHSVLAENDDEILYERLDPHLGYTLPHSGSYNLKLRAWNHPMGSGAYTITLLTDNQPPTLTITAPSAGDLLPLEVITITAAVTDSTGGVSRVEFYWHSSDWGAEVAWQPLGTDREAADGWSATFDAAAHYSPGHTVFYAAAYDWAGNWAGDFVWPVGLGYRVYLPVVVR